MPEYTRNSAQHLLPLDVPEWLTRAVAPWRIEAAALWRRGVMLDLRSDRARIPVLVESPTAGPLAMSLLDPRIPAKPGAAFVRALGGQLQRAAELRSWLQRLRSLADQLDAAPQLERDGELAVLIEAWRAWPARETSPSKDVAPLPPAIMSASATLPRSARAALALHRFARGEVLEALADWSALAEGGSQTFAELHLDAIALGLLGRRDDATRALAEAEALAKGADAWLAIARAYEVLEQRELEVAALEQVVALRGGEWDRLRVARARGDFAANEPLPRPKPDATIETRITFARNVIKILESAGRYDDMLVVLSELSDELGDAVPVELVVRAAELHLWRMEAAQARARIVSVAGAGSNDRGQVVLGAVEILEGRVEAGLSILEAVPTEGPARLERLLWLTEAHLALDQLEQALACVDRHIVLENSLIAYLLKLLCFVRIEPEKAITRAFASRTFLDALVADVLPTLRSPEAIAEASKDPSLFEALIRGILDDMGGNRGPHATWCRRDADGKPRLERVDVRPSGREAAVANLIQIRTKSPDEVIAGFEASLRDYPVSPHPCTYRGELLIWLGRYDAALASFDEADSRAPTRWSYVGRAAAYELLGEAKLADRWTREGIIQFGELETATTNVYRGERQRKLGNWEDARRDLEIAVAHKTRRIGARINLALTYRAIGETELWSQQLERLKIDAPAYLWEAGGRPDRPADEATLLAMLELMVGNRSSFLHTMIDREGRFRVVPEPGRFVAHARLTLALARDELGRVIARRAAP